MLHWKSRLRGAGVAVAAIAGVGALTYAAVGASRTLPRLAAERGHVIATAEAGEPAQDRVARAGNRKDVAPAPKRDVLPPPRDGAAQSKAPPQAKWTNGRRPRVKLRAPTATCTGGRRTPTSTPTGTTAGPDPRALQRGRRRSGSRPGPGARALRQPRHPLVISSKSSRKGRPTMAGRPLIVSSGDALFLLRGLGRSRRFLDGPDHARHRPFGGRGHPAHVLLDQSVVLGDRLQLGLGPHVHDLVTPGLERGRAGPARPWRDAAGCHASG